MKLQVLLSHKYFLWYETYGTGAIEW